MHNKFELALEISKEEDAAWFVNMVNYLYLVELNGWNENFLYFPCGINFYSYLCTQKSTESHFTDVFGHHSS